MDLSEFDFELPEELIALRPVHPRPASRMLVANAGQTADAQFKDLPKHLRAGDLLVANNTQVIPARLQGSRTRQTHDGGGVAKIEALLIRRLTADIWQAMVRPAKRIRSADILIFTGMSAEVLSRDGPVAELRFDRSGDDLDHAIDLAGDMPLPPYIAQKRPADERDREDYQTVFANRAGAIAAPTASLHFDRQLLSALSETGVGLTTVTLHVGAGTFLPVKTERVDDHKMHAEWGEISGEAAAAINAARASKGRVIALGTTALRLIESAAADDRTVTPFVGDTDIFIKPGHTFRIADGLVTNFHLPRSTLFMLVSALMGTDRMQALYAHAIAKRYRFYSYGDGSLLLP